LEESDILGRRVDFQGRSEEPKKRPKEGVAKLKRLVAKFRNRVSEQEKDLEEQSRVIDALRDNMILGQEVKYKLNTKILAIIQENTKLCTSLKKTHFINETANIRITELENIEEEHLQRKNMEVHHNYVNNVLRLSLRKPCRNRKEEEAALHDRIKNLNLKFIDTQIVNKEVVYDPLGNIRITDLDIMFGEKDLEKKNTEAFQNYVTN
jgi:hypothetical protein